MVRGPYEFYSDTFALEIDHGSFLARYGEVQGYTYVKAGDSVTAGQRIARVGHLVGIDVPSDMLHLELYANTLSGALTQPAGNSLLRSPDNVPFYRRKDLQNPTDRLNTWQSRLPQAY